MSHDPFDPRPRSQPPRSSSSSSGSRKPGSRAGRSPDIDPDADDDAIGKSLIQGKNAGSGSGARAKASASLSKGSSASSRSRGDQTATEPPKFWERVFFGRVGAGQLAALCRHWSQYQLSGIDMLRTMDSLRKRFSGSALGPVLNRVTASVREGDDLTTALRKEPEAFDRFFLAMMSVAEARGGIPETLRELASHYEARQRMIRQARSALIYPAAVLIVALLVTLFLSIVVLPMFASLLQDIAGRNGGALPFPSRVLMAFSDFMTRWGWWFVPLAALGGTAALVRGYQRSRAMKRIIDSLLFRAPGLGKLFRQLDEARFARSLSALIEGGVGVQESLKLAGDLMNLEPLRSAARRAGRHIDEGESLASAIGDGGRGRFSEEIVAVAETGEESGRLPEAFGQLAETLEEQVEHSVRNLGNLLKPLMVLLLGGLVFFIILAVVLPYVSLLSNLAGS